MFGLVLPNEKALSEEGKKRYSKIYCGICRSLSSRHGRFAKYTLNYDIAFLALVLSDVYETNSATKSARCLPHPIKKREYTESEIIDYAADMNIVLSYYKLLDDYADNGSKIAKHNADKLKRTFDSVQVRYPEQCACVKKAISELSALEKAGEMSADKTSMAFARTLEAVFAYGDKSTELSALGFALGKFIYIADACIDLKKDLKRSHYNPMSFYSRSEFQNILELLSAEIKECLERLPKANNDEIVKNIIYSGIWLKIER